VRAFPTAEGFGAGAVGGRGPDGTTTAQRQVIYVTNLNDSGSGSLREALLTSGPRFVLFKVAGNIEIESRILITDPYLTVAGQWAPNGGVCIRAAPGFHQSVIECKTHNVIFRHVKMRSGFVGDQYPNPTAGSAGDSSRNLHNNDPSLHDVIYDHCSFTWGTDICAATSYGNGITFQWCIISECLHDAGHDLGLHSKAFNHSFGDLNNLHYNITDHHNLISSSEQRHPQLAGSGGDVEVINNVMHHCTNVGINVNTSPTSPPLNQTGRIVKNYFQDLANYPSNREVKIGSPRGATTKIYVFGNKGPSRPTDTEAQYLSVNGDDRSPAMGGTAGDDPITTTDPTCGGQFNAVPVYPVTEESAQSAFNRITSATPTVGALEPVQDPTDARIITNARTNARAVPGGPNQGLLNHPGQTETPDNITWDGGYTDLTTIGSPRPTDTNDDGIPDAHPLAGTTALALAANGYTNLENYLNELAGDTIPSGNDGIGTGAVPTIGAVPAATATGVIVGPAAGGAVVGLGAVPVVTATGDEAPTPAASAYIPGQRVKCWDDEVDRLVLVTMLTVTDPADIRFDDGRTATVALSEVRYARYWDVLMPVDD
jgi:hypothetical protein